MFDVIIHKWLRVPYQLHVRRSKRVKNARATVVLLHGLGLNGAMWQKVVESMPPDIRVVTVDLLGFGESPKPHWQTYDAKVQVRSLVATFIGLHLRGPVIMVGHSLGSLVAIEFAKQFSLYINSLVLISPPLYKPDDGTRKLLPPPDKTLRNLFRSINKYPEAAYKLMQFATKYSLANPHFTVNRSNYPMFLSALEACVINQTTYESIKTIKMPVEIVYGRFDPFVIAKNMKQLANSQSNIKAYDINASHDITDKFVTKTIMAINDAANANTTKPKSR